MNPRFSLPDSINGVPSNAVFSRERGPISMLSRGRTNVLDGLIGDRGPVVGRPVSDWRLKVTAFFAHIGVVIGWRSKPKMVRIAAASIIASVADVEGAGVSVMDSPRKAAGYVCSATPKAPVTIRRCSLPPPALSFSNLDFGPERAFKGAVTLLRGIPNKINSAKPARGRLESSLHLKSITAGGVHGN